MNARTCAALAITLLASACAPSAALRPDSRGQLTPALASAIPGAGTLPAAGEAYAALPDGKLQAEAAVALGLRNDPRVRVELARLDIVQAERIQAGLVSNPMVSLMALRPSGGGRFGLDYSLMQSLFDLFTRSRRVAVADARQSQVEAEVLARLLDYARETELAYYRAVTAQALLEIEVRDLALERQASEVASSEAKSGSGSAQAAIAQEAAVSMQAHEVQAAQAALSDARSALALALGLSSASALRIASELPPSALPELDPQALAAAAAARSPDLAAARFALAAEQAEAGLESDSALRNLEPAAGLAGTRESDGMRLDGLELQLRLPLFDRGQGRRALADAKVQQARANVEVVERELPLEVERAWASLIAAQSAADHAAHHRRLQKGLEDLARRSYANAGASFEDWLQARREDFAAERDLARARLAASEAAVELRRVTAGASLAN